MTTEDSKKVALFCVVGRHRTESDVKLLQTGIDDYAGWIVAGTGGAGVYFPSHNGPMEDYERAYSLAKTPETFTRKNTARESITKSYWETLIGPVQVISYNPPQLYGECYAVASEDSISPLYGFPLEPLDPGNPLLGGALPSDSVSDDLMQVGAPDVYVTELATPSPHKEALEWIKSATGLSWEDIGNDLLGVSRPTLLTWRRGEAINRSHRQHLFAVREVLEQAVKYHSGPNELSAWLDRPRGREGKTPAELIKAGEIDRARLMAITIPSSTVKMPAATIAKRAADIYASSREHTEYIHPTNDEELFGALGEDDDD